MYLQVQNQLAINIIESEPKFSQLNSQEVKTIEAELMAPALFECGKILAVLRDCDDFSYSGSASTTSDSDSASLSSEHDLVDAIANNLTKHEDRFIAKYLSCFQPDLKLSHYLKMHMQSARMKDMA